MVILDTNIIIDHLRQSGSKESFLEMIVKREGSKALFISMITLQELYEGKSTKEEEKLQDMLTILSPISIIDYTKEIAVLAGKIARDLKLPIEFADVAIAASALFHGATLFTLNRKHFKDIPDLELYEI